MKRHLPQQYTGRVLALALGLVAALATIGFAEGIFAKLAPGELAALALFALSFALATYLCDSEVRSFVDRAFGRRRRAPPAPRAHAKRSAVA